MCSRLIEINHFTFAVFQNGAFVLNSTPIVGENEEQAREILGRTYKRERGFVFHLVKDWNKEAEKINQERKMRGWAYEI